MRRSWFFACRLLLAVVGCAGGVRICWPATLTYSPDVRLLKNGASLNVSCRAAPLNKGQLQLQLATAFLRKSDYSILVEYSKRQVAINRVQAAQAQRVSTNVLHDGMTFTFANVTVRNQNGLSLSHPQWLPVGCELHVVRNHTVVHSYCVMQRAFHFRNASVGVPVIAWNARRLREGELMPPVTCLANVGQPAHSAELTLLHLASNGTRLQDVRALRSKWQTTLHGDGSFVLAQLYEIGCWLDGKQCDALSRRNHGDWLECTARNVNGVRVARKQLRVDHRMNTLRVLDAWHRPLDALVLFDVAQFDDYIVLQPQEKRRSLRYACVADGVPESAIAWTGSAQNAASIVQENDSDSDILVLDLRTPHASVTIETFQCHAVQRFRASETISRMVTVRVHVTADEVVERSTNYFRSWVLFAVLASGTLVIVALLFSVCCYRKACALVSCIGRSLERRRATDAAQRKRLPPPAEARSVLALALAPKPAASASAFAVSKTAP